MIMIIVVVVNKSSHCDGWKGNDENDDDHYKEESTKVDDRIERENGGKFCAIVSAATSFWSHFTSLLMVELNSVSCYTTLDVAVLLSQQFDNNE